MQPQEDRRPGVIERAELILQAVAEAKVIGPSELARITGLAKTTTYRLAMDLVEVGFLERAGDGFRLGYRLFELGNRVTGPRHLREAAVPLMEHMLHICGQTVHLAVLKGDEVSYVDRVFASHPSRIPSAVAARLPLHNTATGKCFLAFGAADPESAIPGEPQMEPGRLHEELAIIRRDGVAFEHGEVVSGVSSVAAPVFGHGGTVEAALSITGFDDELDIEQAVPLVRSAAQSLSAMLGGSTTD